MVTRRNDLAVLFYLVLTLLNLTSARGQSDLNIPKIQRNIDLCEFNLAYKACFETLDSTPNLRPDTKFELNILAGISAKLAGDDFYLGADKGPEFVKKHLQEAKRLQKILKPEPVWTAQFLTLEGLVEFDRNEDLALDLHSRAIQIRRKSLGEYNIEVGKSLQYIGNCMYGIDHSKKGIRISTDTLLKSLRILEACLPDNHPHLITIHRDVGWNLEELIEMETNALVKSQLQEQLDFHNRKYNSISRALGDQNALFRLTYFKAADLIQHDRIREGLAVLASLENNEIYHGNDSLIAFIRHEQLKAYQQIGEFELAMSCFAVAQRGYSTYLPESSYYYDLLNDYAILLGELGQYERAIENFKAYLGFAESTEIYKPINISRAYLNMGNQFQKLGDYTKAIVYHRASKKIRLENKLSSELVGNAHFALSSTLEVAEDLQQAIQEVELAIQAFISVNAVHRIIDCNFLKARCESALGQSSRANKTLTINDELISTSFSNPEIELKNTMARAEVLMKAEEFNEALSVWTKGAHIAETRKMKFSDVNSLTQKVALGKIYKALKEYDKLEILLNEMNQLSENITSGNKTELLNHQLVFEMELLELEFLIQKKVRPDRIVNHCLSAIERLESVTRFFSENKSELEHRKAIHRFYGTAIKFLSEAKPEGWESEVFRLSNQSRSALLERRNRVLTNLASLGIPDDLIRKEQLLRKKISDLQTNFAQDNQYRDSLFQSRVNYYELIEYLETEYPKYASLKRNREPVSVEAVQSSLQPNECLLQYFWSDQVKCAIIINEEGISISQVDAAISNQDIVAFREAIEKNERKAYLSIGNELHKSLINPVVQKLRSKIYVNPDGPLSFLPFDCLNQASDAENFLIRKYTISYLLTSLELVDRNRETAESHFTMAAYAPAFDEGNNLVFPPFGKDEILEDIFGNAETAEFAVSLFGGEVFDKKSATKDRFANTAASHSLIHIGTHGVSDAEMGWKSRIYFRSEDQFEVMYASEIEALNLNAELVMLNACQTATGELSEGEGIIGLTRSFQLAGAKSVISSMWNLNAAKGHEITETFYSIYGKGEIRKDEALRKAKLNMLNDGVAKDPYYWAALSAYGNMDPLPNTRSTFKWWWLLILASPLILLLKIRS